MGIIEHTQMFFKKNWVGISLVVVGLFLMLAVIAIQNIQFKEHPDQKLEKVILYEKFSGREGFVEGISVNDMVKKMHNKKKTFPKAANGVQMWHQQGHHHVGPTQGGESCHFRRAEGNVSAISHPGEFQIHF